MAEVAQDGPFSCFEGVDRRLYILAGTGIDLRLADGTQRLQQGEHLDFAGEAAMFGVLIDGPVTDFNIMVRRGQMRMRAATLRFEGPRQIDHGWGTAALFVLAGELAVMNAVARRFDTVLLDDARPLSVSGTAEVLLIGFEALD
jgi:environmental stress-induced protein Ves